jgi:hypothetical protein
MSNIRAVLVACFLFPVLHYVTSSHVRYFLSPSDVVRPV